MPAPSRFVYVGTYTAPNTAPGGARPSAALGISVLRLDGRSGALAPVQVVEGIENPSWVTLDPGLRVLYAVSEVAGWAGRDGSGGLTGYAVDEATGRLTRLGDQPTGGAIPAHDVVDPSGRFVLVANYAGASFSVLPILEGGRPGPATEVHAVSGTGPDRSRQEAPHPHQVLFDPAGAFVHGPDLGSDRVWSWRLDPAAGRLAPADPPAARLGAGSGPRHLAFHPGGRFAYVVEELASAITAFAYDGATGAFSRLHSVSSLPPGAAGANTAGEILVHPGGGFVYASNRGHDSIGGFAVDQETGRLTPAGWTSTGGQVPRGVAIDPSGHLLLAANQNSDTIVPFEIDAGTGALRPTGYVTRTSTPVCIQFGRVGGG